MKTLFVTPAVLLAMSCLANTFAAQPDWLLRGQNYPATVAEVGDTVVLDNGLVKRTIRTKNGSGTIGFDNRLTGEQLLRSVRPEALLNIDGTDYAVGGLVGQPIQNYLNPDWLAKMTPQPNAFVLDRTEFGKTQQRFAWKKRPEWMPKDLPWPAPGVSATLFYRAPAEGFVGAAPARKVLLADDFLQQKLDPAWTAHYSKAHDRTSFENEGKVGEIMALPQTFAAVERDLPTGTQIVQCKIDPGTDRGGLWGPGIVLMYPEKNIKFNLFAIKQKFAVLDEPAEKYQDGKSYLLRMRIVPGAVFCESSLDGKAWSLVRKVDVAGTPRSVRLGKTGRDGALVDNDKPSAEKAELGRCKFDEFRAFGEQLPPTDKGPVGLQVEVHYELFDDLPLLSKWIVVRNGGESTVRVKSFVAEMLALTESESTVDENTTWNYPKLHVETDYAFDSMNIRGANAAVSVGPDPQYKTQVNYGLKTPCLLQCKPPLGPDLSLSAGQQFESFRVFELAFDSTDRERNGLAMRRMYRCISPWVTENPILMHVRDAKPEAVKLAIDQCADVGFEMAILTFGSGFNYENADPVYQAKIKELVDYGKSKGVTLGGYSLLASRKAGTPQDNTQGVPARFGVMPCLGAQWGIDYLKQLQHFMEVSGLAVLEHDGSYPGDRCAATNHPGHHGLEDSQWVQWRGITDFYKTCRARGVYLNIPDWYFLSGGSKTGMGYREVNWSLPREYQEIIERQNIYDGTWEKTPSMGWMFVPLTQYHGGGAAATIEPLKDHLPHYDLRMANLFGAGVQACYRGPRLYDADQTRTQVKKWVDFYKAHRQILDADIIHLRRADGRDLDYFLHVDPLGKEKGLLMIYNPLPTPVAKTLSIPLYYTGLTDSANVRNADGGTKAYPLDRAYHIDLPVAIPSNSYSHFVIQ